jgi:FAD/FMN-containing dehydrogenase
MDRSATLDLATLSRVIRGTILERGQPGFADEVAAFNAFAHHTPLVVVIPEDAHDVQQTVLWARRHDVVVGVQATGHGAVASYEGGVLVSTRKLQDLHVDAENSTARIGAGVRWRAVIDAAAPYGLAPLSGSSSGVGAIGYTLGGGLPVLGRTFGFASDLVQSFEIVTADGELRTVAESQEQDLFFALRGGKPTVGIVTSMTMRLVPVSTIYGGCIFWEGKYAASLLEAYRLWTPLLPERLTASLKLMRLPPMPHVPEPLRQRLTVQLVVAHVGDSAEGARLLAPMRSIAPSIFDEVREMPYPEVDTLHRDPQHPVPASQTCVLLEDLNAPAEQAILSIAGPDEDCPLLMVELRHLGGSLARVQAAPDAVGWRNAGYSVFFLGLLVPPLRERVPAALTEAVARMSPYATKGTFVNMYGKPFGHDDKARPWPKDIQERLLAIKHRFDPDGVFRFAHWLPAGTESSELGQSVVRAGIF